MREERFLRLLRFPYRTGCLWWMHSNGRGGEIHNTFVTSLIASSKTPFSFKRGPAHVCPASRCKHGTWHNVSQNGYPCRCGEAVTDAAFKATLNS